MTWELRTTIFIITMIFVSINYWLLIHKKVTEKSTLLWSIGIFPGIIVAAFPTILNRIAHLVGVSYPPALLFLITILGLLTIVLYQSMQISVLEQKMREIARTVTLVEHDLEKHRQGQAESS